MRDQHSLQNLEMHPELSQRELEFLRVFFGWRKANEKQWKISGFNTPAVFCALPFDVPFYFFLLKNILWSDSKLAPA